MSSSHFGLNGLLVSARLRQAKHLFRDKMTCMKKDKDRTLLHLCVHPGVRWVATWKNDDLLDNN